MPDASQIDFAYSRLEFKCVYERDSLPVLNSDADIFYRYGLYLEKRKGQKDYDAIARYYRIAAAHDHYKAANNLQFLLSTGQARSPDASKEVIDLAEYFISKGIPGAYYDMAHYLELGYGVKQDIATSRAYFRRAADLGNPDAQYYVGRLLSYVPNTAETMLAMYKCAMEQGNSKASRKYAIYSKGSGLYQEAVHGHQTAIRNGNDISAHSLANAFKGPPASDELYYLALQQDDERVDRYNKISDFLSRHEHLGAKVPDLDDIVPLPPATLPEWDGTFQWKRERDSAVPIIPSAELIEKLSAEKGLDPATGLPLPKTPRTHEFTAGSKYAGKSNKDLGEGNQATSDIVQSLDGHGLFEKDEQMSDVASTDVAYSRLEFKCVYERDSLPALNLDADIFYKYGLYLEKRKGQKDYDAIARYYRIAAAHDHYKAATNLQFLLSTGQAGSPDASKEVIDLAEYFISIGIPGAFYNMGHYLELGYGVKQDVAASRAYFRRAADLGNPDAQYYVGRLLSYVPNTVETMLAMYKCAMQQGNRLAGRSYASYSKAVGAYQDSLVGYQSATRHGDANSAGNLASAFAGPHMSDELYYLALEKDDERINRYKHIRFFLRRHEHLGAKVPDLDDIVPLPPATLPEWDGTFQWKRERDSAVSIIPSAELIEKLSAEKGLDPATGLPLPKTAGDF